MKKLLLCLLLLCLIAAEAAPTLCATCGRKASRFFSFGRKWYCSPGCVPPEKKCRLCGSLLTGEYMTFVSAQGGRRVNFCVSCAHRERCISCKLPADKGIRNASGGLICDFCRKQIITPAEAAQIMRKLRKELAERFGFDPKHPISLKMTDRANIAKFSGHAGAVGFTKVETQKFIRPRGAARVASVKLKTAIYIADDLSLVEGTAVLAHELTHDFLFRTMGVGTDKTITEGICEAVAGDWLLRHGHRAALGLRQANPDPVYGTGFRTIFPQLRQYGFKGMLERNKGSFKPLL